MPLIDSADLYTQFLNSNKYHCEKFDQFLVDFVIQDKSQKDAI